MATARNGIILQKTSYIVQNVDKIMKSHILTLLHKAHTKNQNQVKPYFPYCPCVMFPHPHLVRANTIRFLDKTLAKQHLTPQNYPPKWPPKMTQKMTQKMTLQYDPSIRSPLIHAHKVQDRAEIKIIRYMKRVKTEFLSSKLVRFSKQI